jgi:hypothetical protein
MYLGPSPYEGRDGMMKTPATILLLFATASMALAHPSVDIVQDKRGNIYYTDTKQVFRIAPDGGMSVAVPSVHTHELAFDSMGSLYGEHLWYDERLPAKWAHRVWRMAPDGRISDVYPQRDGFMTDFGLVRDDADSMYWANREGAPAVRKKPIRGPVLTLAGSGFRQIQWMTAAPDGTVFLIDAGALKQVSPQGVVNTVLAAVTAEAKPPADVHHMNYQMGLHAASDGSVYVAVPSEKLVLKVQSNGTKSVAARSQAPWAPSGVLVDSSGALWMLEFDPSNAMRVVKIGANGSQRVFAPGR